MTERLTLSTSDGLTLEARIDSPESPLGMTVFCHPHPLHGGSMNAPLMIAIAGQLVAHGLTVLRFNFRGTGASSGEHDHGKGELEDITSAVAHAETRGLPVSIAGWSFGASTTLSWIAANESTVPYVGVAPPADLLPEELPDGPKRLILGSRDQVIDGDALTAYAIAQSIDLLITPGDHFFHGRGKRVGDLVAQGLTESP